MGARPPSISAEYLQGAAGRVALLECDLRSLGFEYGLLLKIARSMEQALRAAQPFLAIPEECTESRRMQLQLLNEATSTVLTMADMHPALRRVAAQEAPK